MHFRGIQLLLVPALLAAAPLAWGQTVTTDPVGFVELAISPSPNGTTRALTVLSFPLLASATSNGTDAIAGTAVGRIGSVTANTVTVTEAGWTAGQLSQAAFPKLFRITSGAAEGRTFLISTTVPNTADTFTLATSEAVDLTTLGIVAGTDTFKILDCDTLSSLFGTPGTFAIVGNNDPNLADNVLLLINGVWNTYYFHVTNNRWTKRGPGSPDATVQAVKPESAVLFSRIGTTALSLTVTGDVPMSKRSDTVKKTGLSFMASNWPVDVTLLDSGIQNVPGWIANTSVTSADQLLLLVNGVWNTYWWNGTNWRKRGPGSPISDSQVILAGSGIILSRVGTNPSDSLLLQNRPY